VGDPDYTRYRDYARAFWDWAHLVGAPLAPNFSGRDRFWANLGITLYELSVAEGAPDDAVRQEALDCVNQIDRPPLYNYRGNNMKGRCNGTSYTTGYGRAPAHAMELQHRAVDNYDGGRPTWHNYGENKFASDPAMPQSPDTPFAHGAGREYVAGVQRAHWFYYTFPDRPDPPDIFTRQPMPVPGNWTVESWSRYAILEYWRYARDNMWDNTDGYQAWWESQSKLYKPCFSLGTPVPIGDWQAPVIGSKVHTLNADGSATVTVGGVRDEEWPYLSWNFRGIGVAGVRVWYATDSDPTWRSLEALETPAGSGSYVATIPALPEQTVYYYAEALDAFGNSSTFPANAPALYQLYTTRDRTYNVAWTAGAQSDVGITIIEKGDLAVSLARLEAAAEGEGVALRWQTASEQDNYGFHVWRAASRQRATAERLTVQAIPGQGAGAQQGASYSYVDAQPPGPAYYWLEALDLDGSSAFYGPVAPRAPAAQVQLHLPLVAR
jgi:hypothetical protein